MEDLKTPEKLLKRFPFTLSEGVDVSKWEQMGGLKMKEEKEVLIFTTVCLFVAEIGLLYHGYYGFYIPSIINLPVSIGCGALLSYWFD